MSTVINAKGKYVSIENDIIRIAFDRTLALRIASVVDKRSTCEFIRDLNNPGMLFYLEIINNDDPLERRSLSTNDARIIELSDEDGVLRIDASDFEGMSDLTVSVTIYLDEEGFSHWKLDTLLPDNWHIYTMKCPIIIGLFIPGNCAEGECVVFPCLGEGYLFHDPFPTIDGLPMKSGTGPDRLKAGLGFLSGKSPGFVSMQMMLYYNNEAGLYIATYDAQGDAKEFTIGVDESVGGSPVMSIAHRPQRGCGIEYDTIVGVFKGDWYDGADIYKKWARRQPWCETLMKNRRQPEWLRKGFAVFQMGNYGLPKIEKWNTMDEIAEYVNKVSKDAGVPIAGLVFNYENKGGWTGPIGIFPPREGEKAFSDAMKKMSDMGNLGFVYIPFGMWYAHIPYSEPFNSEKELHDEASHYAVRDKYGNVRINYREDFGWKNVNLCPAGKGMYDLSMGMVNNLIDLGCKVIQLDNWPVTGAQECFGEKHGHPPGFGRWWAQEYLRITKNLLDEVYLRDPEVAITVENVSEQFLQCFHLHDQRAGNSEYFGHWCVGMPAGAEIIPLFNYIYNPVTGSYLAAYPECAMPETMYWNRSVARSVCHGVIPTSGFYYGKASEVNDCCIKYFQKVAAITSNLLWEFIMYGEMLRAPVTNAPVVKIPYFTLNDPNSGLIEYKRDFDYQFAFGPAVETAAFSSPDGRTALIFFNITNDQLLIEAICPNMTGIELLRFNDGVDAGKMCCSESGELMLCMSPLEVVILMEVPEVEL